MLEQQSGDHFVHLRWVCCGWGCFETTGVVSSNESSVGMTAGSWQWSQVVEVLTKNRPATKSQLQQTICFAEEPGGLRIVRPIGALMEYDRFHAPFLCHCSQGLQLPDTRWRSIARPPEVLWVLPETNCFGWGYFQRLYASHHQQRSQLCFLFEVALQPWETKREFPWPDRLGPQAVRPHCPWPGWARWGHDDDVKFPVSDLGDELLPPIFVWHVVFLRYL